MHTTQPIYALCIGLHILLSVYICLMLCLPMLHDFFFKFGNEVV